MNIEDPEERAALQQEIQSAIAAGREVGPDMDKHLADSVLDRYAKERAARERAASTKAVTRSAVAPPATPSSNVEVIGRMVMSVIGLVAIVAILLIRPEYFWLPLIFGMMILRWWGRGGRRGWHGRHSYRSYYRRNDDLGDAPPRNLDSTVRSQSEFI